MIDYHQLKRVAASAGVSPSEILALAPQNDPFYVGARKQLQKGKWFAEIYRLMGEPARCHIRRVHYWLVTTNAVPKPDGKPYENTQGDWGLLTLAAKYARYLGLVPIENIIDRRNPDPIVNAQHWKHQKASSIRDSIDETNIIDSIVSQFYAFNPSETQPYLIELVCEKSTLNDVLEPICQRYGLNLITGLGELSITASYLLAKRIVESKKAVRILYISDFDPAGECMPLSFSRKIEYFVRTHDLKADIKLIPLVLTAAQCEKYNLPRTPIKDSEKRKDKFEERHGVGATELDAMEALHPGEMDKIISEEVLKYFDVDTWNAAIRKNRELQAYVREYLVGGECHLCDEGKLAEERTCPGCVGRGHNKTENPCKTCSGVGYLIKEVDCATCAGTGSIPGKISTEILTSLDVGEFDSYHPASAEQVDIPERALYDSSLEYLDQIDTYRRHKAQGVGGNNSDPFEGD